MSLRGNISTKKAIDTRRGMDLDLVGTKQPDEATLKVDPSFDLNMQPC